MIFSQILSPSLGRIILLGIYDEFWGSTHLVP